VEGGGRNPSRLRARGGRACGREGKEETEGKTVVVIIRRQCRG
jgi:hypothetical protein